MNIFVKKLIRNFLTIISYVIRYDVIRVFWFIRDELNSAMVKRELRQCGDNFKIKYPTLLQGGNYITIGKDFSCFSGLRIEAYDRHLNNTYQPYIQIGDNVSINYDCHIACVNKIVIGNNVLMASKIFITDHYHGDINAKALEIPPNERKVISRGEVIIEANVWIGEGVAIMPGVIIGKNSIIGANSVVTKDIPSNCVAAGVPARIIKIM